MINLTDSAKNELTQYFKDKDATPIRIHLADGGCSGMRLSMALDEQRDGDKSDEQGGFTFLMHEELAEKTGVITVDMTEYGFTIASENEIPGMGGGCGCASSGSCGSAGSGGCGGGC